jgi:hypothetical protein
VSKLLVVTIAEAAYRVLATCVERGPPDLRGRRRGALPSPPSPPLRRTRWTWARSASTWGAARPPPPSSRAAACVHVGAVPVGGQHVT